MKDSLARAKEALNGIMTKIYVGYTAPSKATYQWGLMALGLVLLVVGLTVVADAQAGGGGGGGAGGRYSPRATYNDHRIAEAVDVIFLFINGTFGALIMVAAGVAAILSSAFGQYRAALGLMVVAVGSFVLRSLVKTWFNTTSLRDDIGDLQPGQTGGGG